MLVIVGLGNPDKKYAKNMHNMGFMALDILAQKLNVNFSQKGFKGIYAEYRNGGEKHILLKPQTYMNLSGESVREIMDFYKLSPDDIVVVYDDLDINIGSIRIRKKGSAGTHNGMRNIVLHLNSSDFLRIRIGIKPENDSRGIIDYVLSDIKKQDQELFETTLNKVANALYDYIKGDKIDDIMRKYNG